jgi:universal stress protein E
MRRFRSILCAISADAASAATVQRAASLAENNQASLTLVDTRAPTPRTGTDPTATRAERLRLLETLTAAYRERLPIRCEVPDTADAETLIRTVLRDGHDLLIKRAVPVGLVDKLMARDDIRLLRQCPCPVWLTRPEDSPNYGCILVAIDYDPERPETLDAPLNRQLLELAASLALSDFAELNVVHVWDAPGEGLVRAWSDDPDEASERYVGAVHARHRLALGRVRDILRAYLGADAYGYLAPNLQLERGAAYAAIPEAAARLGADLVVIGTVGRGSVAGWLIGNTAEALLGRLACSVLAVKPPEFASPVKLAAPESG